MKTSVFSTLAGHAKRQAGRLWALGLAVGLAASMAGSGPADAHGEKSQAAFLRMRTLNWYDVKWSKTSLNVNEEMEITGKLHIMDAWPVAVAKPEVAFLNVGMPGPVLVREGSFLGGKFVPRSTSLELGKTYEFRVLLKARRQGRWHVHTQLSVQTGGPIIGPGQWVEIKGDMADFKNPVTLLNGEVIDLEQYKIGNIYFWHTVWFIAGVAWVFYWFRKRGFVGRYISVASGKGGELITPLERQIGAGALAATLLVVIISYALTASEFPRTIPLQAGNIRAIDALNIPESPIKVEYLRGTYKVPGRELVATYKITNTGKEPVRVGEFATATLRFLNPDVYTQKVDYPEYILAERGLSLSDNAPIAPGETKELTVKVQDARWDTERLADLAYDVDSSFAGLMFFFTPSGARYEVETGGPVIPEFLPI
ncbi:bacterial ammonia monooxygenase, subunit AmoB [Methylocapsa acidiphila]|uniref:bacterial ammonia monooxygenase, subunit AmoB n=1 Tax=Methylocapsa acidiphila TaxID=133552 RepID=UPI00040DD3FA|nr:bacterial ammonia monooxygenase, subunit AmoB [Methylocapsa acidiphila]